MASLILTLRSRIVPLPLIAVSLRYNEIIGTEILLRYREQFVKSGYELPSMHCSEYSETLQIKRYFE